MGSGAAVGSSFTRQVRQGGGWNLGPAPPRDAKEGLATRAGRDPWVQESPSLFACRRMSGAGSSQKVLKRWAMMRRAPGGSHGHADRVGPLL